MLIEKNTKETIVLTDLKSNNTSGIAETGINSKCICDASPKHKHKQSM
ncbi:MAG: hypothetical protein ACXVPY_03660 [Bacteroidia bacterium]